MGFLNGVFSRRRGPGPEFDAIEVLEAAADDDEELIEIEVVGESHRQEVLAAIAGPKDAVGKRERSGVTLRCEPTNPYDANAVRVEVLGQLVGYVQRDLAALVHAPMMRNCGGAVEARGLIVGGWKDGEDEGHYGIRVWITSRDAARLGLRPDELDSSLRPAWPDAPSAGPDERRLSPTETDLDAGRYGSMVTVVSEEHYQPIIEAAIPTGSRDRSWPVLVELHVVPCNPHERRALECVEVRIGMSTVGYWTPRMTERHIALLKDCVSDGKRATAVATVSRGTKAGNDLWRIKVALRDERSG